MKIAGYAYKKFSVYSLQDLKFKHTQDENRASMLQQDSVWHGLSMARAKLGSQHQENLNCRLS
ncbi:MAG: hypothetical protein D6690_10705 [Nitrospirae bacterium]|nr:MAG: hypothetical protein D6690_10705 [Nitrospirota bacterium]